MLDLNELEQLVTFADLGTLSKVSEHYHISTPTITRTMQHIEESFGVNLFSRTKNRIALNETGLKAVECARRLLKEADNTLTTVRNYDKSLKTIYVKSCAPAPLWNILPHISDKYPEMTISSSICQNDEIIESLHNNNCNVAILPFEINVNNYQTHHFMDENLFVCVKSDHELAKHNTLSFSDINGFNFLLRTELGFWDTLCREKMPASKFLVQKDNFEFDELVNSSSLPCFTTDYFTRNNIPYRNRISIPLTDSEANVSFYMYIKEPI